ncbi:2OG-Fe(II) oxygenase [Gluconobacter roseus]
MDRMLVSSYDATDSGFFDAHRDNTVPSSAHRQFAVSLNLNEGYEGGELVFPEFGQQTFKAPAGGAVVFSCTLLHAVQPVTAGRRYACLPFVY